MNTFFLGMHQPGDAHKVPAACISASRLRLRVGPFKPSEEGWIFDSSGFYTITHRGRYLDNEGQYACMIVKWHSLVPGLRAAVTQDYMCEPIALRATGLTVADHQRITIERYDQINLGVRMLGCDVHIMPVLQGWVAEDYVAHLRQYGDRITRGMWVGVGSVCKRQGNPEVVKVILRAIKAERPDILLHCFGVKITALEDPEIRELIETADSMSWSFAARYEGRDANSADEALDYYGRVMALAA